VRDRDAHLHALTREELRTLVHDAGDRISSRYRQMLISILDLEKVTVDDVMVPHNEINGIDLDDEPEEIERIVNESEHTRSAFCTCVGLQISRSAHSNRMH